MGFAYLDKYNVVVPVSLDDKEGLQACMMLSDEQRLVAVSKVGPTSMLSTVFLGCSVCNKWFETALIDRTGEQRDNFKIERRYTTYEEAVKGHGEILSEIGDLE